MTLQDTDNQAAAGKYLTFFLQGGNYGIPITKVREIIAVQPITALPRMPSAVRGVINLRGKIIPVVDLRSGLGLHAAAHDRATCIIVLDVEVTDQNASHIGCIVDAVSEVVDVQSQELQDPPSIGSHTAGSRSRSESILALAKREEDDHVVTLLDMPSILRGLLGAESLMQGSADVDAPNQGAREAA